MEKENLSGGSSPEGLKPEGEMTETASAALTNYLWSPYVRE